MKKTVGFTILCWVGQAVEVRGCCQSVQIIGQHQVVAEDPRHIRRRLLIATEHYEGPLSGRIIAPLPLGAMGRRLQALASIPVEQRPLDPYAAQAELAR